LVCSDTSNQNELCLSVQYQKLNEHIGKHLPVDLEEALLKMVEEENFVVLVPDFLGSYIQRTIFWDHHKNKPRFHLSTTCYMETNIGWVAPKNAKYTPMLMRGLRLLGESGLIEKWKEDLVWRKREQQWVRENLDRKRKGFSKWVDEGRTLSLEHLGYANKLMMFGWIVGFACFLAENAWHIIKAKKLGNAMQLCRVKTRMYSAENTGVTQHRIMITEPERKMAAIIMPPRFPKHGV
jgi:hypothetical protein